MSDQLTPLQTIERVVAWYAKQPRDYQNIDRLQYSAKTLSCALFDFASEVGGLYKQRNRTEFQRKAEFGRIYRELMAAEQRPSVSAAEKEAESLVSTLRDEEQQADAEYMAAKMLLETAKGVHDQMRQQIGLLRSEKEGTKVQY